MNLIDRASRALAASIDGHDDWDKLGAARQERFKNGVRTLLKSLRDPDERMAEAGAAIIRNVGPAESETVHRSDAANTWRFMMDALVRAEK